MNDHLNWGSAASAEKKLFGEFLGGAPSEERIYQAIFVVVCSGFQQFVADLLDEICEALTERKLPAKEADQLFPGILAKQRRFAGHPLDRIEEPRAYWGISYDDLVDALSTTKMDHHQVRFYGRSIAANLSGFSLDALNAAFSRLSLVVPWAEICKEKELQKILGTAAQAETRKALNGTLLWMMAARNSLAHSQGSEVIGYVGLEKCMRIADVLSEQLSKRLLSLARGSSSH